MVDEKSVAILRSRALRGVQSPAVLVEAHLSPGLPSFSIVGMPEKAVRESRERVRAAIENCSFEFPTCRVIVSLAPAELPKAGGRFDLPIALGILIASRQVPSFDLDQVEIIGELSLDGRVRRVAGALVTAIHSARSGRPLVVPDESLNEARLTDNATLIPIKSLNQLVGQVIDREFEFAPSATVTPTKRFDSHCDLAQVRGQSHARRALEIAAAGQFNVIFVGPPGTGKTMLARRLPGLLPPMGREEALATAALLSISGQGQIPESFGIRPFRSPHHSASGAAIIGGGSYPRPGEVSLAHNGVLFLDEMPEFDRRVLDMLREPLETREVHIARASGHLTFPAHFQLVGALNPCPCGFNGDPRRQCLCTADAVARYRQKLSGPLLDRIDLHVEVPAVSPRTLAQGDEEGSTAVAERVRRAWEQSFDRSGQALNALSGSALHAVCQLTPRVRDYLFNALDELGLSLRVHDRLLRVARVIADLESEEAVSENHLAEALSLRLFDRPPTRRW